jgi:hypothetical protein
MDLAANRYLDSLAVRVRREGSLTFTGRRCATGWLSAMPSFTAEELTLDVFHGVCRGAAGYDAAGGLVMVQGELRVAASLQPVVVFCDNSLTASS